MSESYRNQDKFIVVWDGKDENGTEVPAGTYIVSASDGEMESSQKMVKH